MKRRAFTLVELIVAVLVGALIAGATTTALSSLARGQARSSARHEAYSRAEAAASRIALDVSNLARVRDLASTRFVITNAQSGPADADSVVLVTHGVEAVRGYDDSPEGGEREVQFKLFPREDSASGQTLWRREQPIPDEYADAGGVAAKIAEGIESLSIKAADASAWSEAWSADESGLPHTVSIQVTAISDDGTARATSRRVVAIDRIAKPADEAAETTPTSPTTPTTSTPAATPATSTPANSGGGVTLPTRGGRGNPGAGGGRGTPGGGARGNPGGGRGQGGGRGPGGGGGGRGGGGGGQGSGGGNGGGNGGGGGGGGRGGVP